MHALLDATGLRWEARGDRAVVPLGRLVVTVEDLGDLVQLRAVLPVPRVHGAELRWRLLEWNAELELVRLTWDDGAIGAEVDLPALEDLTVAQLLRGLASMAPVDARLDQLRTGRRGPVLHLN